MNDALYEKIHKKWEDVTEIPPQTVGPFTPYYKMITKRLKVMPMPLLLGLSFALIIGLFMLIGPGITLVTTVLQRGF